MRGLTLTRREALSLIDPRFTANIDQVRPGLSEFARDAFRANAERVSRS
ncbi:TipAS antibiotic-recognition domain-containing protein [Hyalangium versicolor]|nr:TipAS antibiotic-recognition domain-containing protein [Hyalangium versicolor]